MIVADSAIFKLGRQIRIRPRTMDFIQDFMGLDKIQRPLGGPISMAERTRIGMKDHSYLHTIIPTVALFDLSYLKTYSFGEGS